jgi:hypothetical protein
VFGSFGDFPLAAFTTISGVDDDETFSGWNGVEAWPGTGPAPVQPFPAPLPRLSAAFGKAGMVGALRVPPNWTQITTAATEVHPTALTTQLPTANAAAGPVAEFDVANTWNQMGIGAMAGQAMAGPPAAADGQTNGKAARLTGRAEDEPAEDVEVVPAPRTVMTGVAAAIREIAVQRAAGLLSEHEYSEQKKSLLEISFGQ